MLQQTLRRGGEPLAEESKGSTMALIKNEEGLTQGQRAARTKIALAYMAEGKSAEEAAMLAYDAYQCAPC